MKAEAMAFMNDIKQTADKYGIDSIELINKI